MFTIQQLLNIDYPMIQGGMAHVSDWHLASAVSNAGALGVVASGGLSVEEFRENIRNTKKHTTRPFAVNLALTYANIDEIVDVAIEEGVEIAILGGGNPAPFWEKLQDANIRLIPVVGNSKMAKKVEQLGASCCIFEGAEAGGHIGGLNTMAALPAIVDAVDIPVISAGGIASGRQILAAEILGAKGVQLGTRFLAAKETNVHPDFKRAVIEASDIDVTVTGYSAHPVRVLNNDMAKKYKSLEFDPKNKEALEKLGVGAMRRASKEGDVSWGSVMIGQDVYFVKKEETVSDIINSLMKEYEEAKNTL